MQQESVALSDLLAEPFLELSNIHCAGKQIHEICRLSSGQRNTVFLSSQIETIRRLVVQKQGVTIMPQMALDDESELGVRPVADVQLEREITLVQHPDRYLGDTARQLIELLKQFTQDYLQR